MPRQTSIQLTEATERQLDALKAQGYGTTTDIIRLAIDRMWTAESFAHEPSAPAPAVQLWQHRTAGEQYIVAVQHGQCVGAVGPIYQPDRDTLLLAAIAGDWKCDAELADDIAERADDYRVVWPYESA